MVEPTLISNRSSLPLYNYSFSSFIDYMIWFKTNCLNTLSNIVISIQQPCPELNDKKAPAWIYATAFIFLNRIIIQCYLWACILNTGEISSGPDALTCKSLINPVSKLYT